ncbi:MAG: NAD(P)/FAD-dependent oxidoreductase [Candidatus Micrarchaeota archaeon]
MAKIHVVGAGPAGSIAAISACRSGHDVIVSEEHAVSGLPENCSGLFSKDGLESLSGFMDYKRFVIRQMRGADIYLAGEKLAIRRDEAVGFVCDRAAIDQELAARAEAEGAAVNFGERVTDSFRSDNIIGADGPLSSVARHFRFPKIARYAATLQATVPYRAAEPDIVEVFLSQSMFPGFFGWVIPHDEYCAELGVGVAMGQDLQEAWRGLLRRKGVPAALVKPRGASIPISVRRKTGIRAGRKNILLAGDAAGQVKATTGGGVIFGGNCAALAGKLATDPERYEREWRSRFGLDLSIHSALRTYLAGLGDAQLASLGRRLKKLNLDGYLSGHGHMDRPTRMIKPGLFKHIFRNIIA